MENIVVKKEKTDIRDMISVSLFSALIAIGAFIRIPLPNQDYFTLQFLFVLLSGMLLGPRKGLLSVTVYILSGLAGFPVFAAGGGISYVLRPTFGYLIGFAICSFTVGKICGYFRKESFAVFLAASIAGLVIVYSIGFAYKYAILNIYSGIRTPLAVIFLGAFPVDLPGDMLLTFVSAITGLKIKKRMKFIRSM